MTHASIVALIDLQNGFARYDIPQDKGGCLYVPGGENAAQPAADLIRRSKNRIFILSQDFHPGDHISFMENHPGIMALRRSQLEGKYKAEEMDEAVLSPIALSFTNVLVREQNGRYAPIAVEVDGQWRKAITDSNGYIVDISKDFLPDEEKTGAFEQTLWRRHCVQATESSRFDDRLMAALPEDLQSKIISDQKSPVLQSRDENGNLFFVIRKGLRRDLHSYGVATEDDGVTLTEAPLVFAAITDILKKNGVSHVDIDVGGLATNFCAEFSEKDLHKHLVPLLKKAGIGSKVHFLSDISYGIPAVTPDGSWPDLAGTEKRMNARGTAIRTTQDVMRASLKAPSGWLKQLNFD